jgi:drug/metabolite transporter (DMT)-like permease
VRLEHYAQQTTALQLATSKATVEAILSTALVVALLALGMASSSSTCSTGIDASSSTSLLTFLHRSGADISTFFSTVVERASSSDAMSGSLPTPTDDSAIPSAIVVVAAVLWTGWITCAYTIFAQSYGQSSGGVSPTNANLIYSAQPIFTAFFAFLLLGQTLGPAGIAGALLIGASVYIVATASGREDETPSAMTNGMDGSKDALDSFGVLSIDESLEPRDTLVNHKRVRGDASKEVVER